MKSYSTLYTNKLWNDLFEERFCEATNLFYDFPTFHKGEEYLPFLPTPSHMKHSIPNPCGWGSGMEDGCIDGGIMLDCALLCYEREKDPVMIETAKKIFEGLKLCATVSDKEGFLARSVSPTDMKSHYTDSSRDQYTHWVYSMAKYHDSEIISAEDKGFVKKTLCSFAKRAVETVNEKNGWNYLREDGGKAMVNTMWGDKISPHEWMRLPMIYLAAWKIGGDERYKDVYLSIRDEAFERSWEIVPEKHERLFTLNQMQLSLRFVYDYDDDAAFREKCYKLMKRLADYCLKKTLELAETLVIPFRKEDTAYVKAPWSKIYARYQGTLDGYAYYVPLDWRRLPIDDACLKLKIVGDGASAYTLFPDATYNAKLEDKLRKIAESEDREIFTVSAKIYSITSCYILDRLKNK